MYGATIGGPLQKNRIFFFTSIEQWDDNKPLTIVRTLPTDLERRGDFSQSVLNGRVRNIYDPFTSRIDPATGRVVRTPYGGNVIPGSQIDPVARGLLQALPLPNLPGNTDNWQGTVTEKVDYWNFSQRVDVNLTDKLKVFARYGQFKANLYQNNPTEGGLFPLSGSNRYGMSVAGDAVYVMSNRTTVNVRGSFYNMTDEFYNPALLLGDDGLKQLWPNNAWYSSLYNSGYVYYPALDVTSGTGTATTNRLGRQGREWFQHPDAWTVSARAQPLSGPSRHEVGRRGARVLRRGGALRADQPGLQLGAHRQQLRHARRRRTPATSGRRSCWARSMTRPRRDSFRCRTPDLRGYAAYFQDDIHVSDNLTLNVGVRWEYEPGPTDPLNRLSQRLDLTRRYPRCRRRRRTFPRRRCN